MLPHDKCQQHKSTNVTDEDNQLKIQTLQTIRRPGEDMTRQGLNKRKRGIPLYI